MYALCSPLYVLANLLNIILINFVSIFFLSEHF